MCAAHPDTRFWLKPAAKQHTDRRRPAVWPLHVCHAFCRRRPVS